VCSRSVSHRWMECGTKDLQRLPHGMVGRGLAVYQQSFSQVRVYIFEAEGQ